MVLITQEGLELPSEGPERPAKVLLPQLAKRRVPRSQCETFRAGGERGDDRAFALLFRVDCSGSRGAWRAAVRAVARVEDN